MKLFVTICLVIASLSTNSEEIKIGYIDIEQVVNNLPQYQKSTNIISKEFEPKRQELLTLFKGIELLRAKIINISQSENKENLQIEVSKLSRLEATFKQESEFWQERIDARKIESLQEIEILINNTINELAISENYDLILYENAAFVSDEINITKKVIEEIKKLLL